MLAPLDARKYGKRIDLKRLNNLLILVDWVLFILAGAKRDQAKSKALENFFQNIFFQTFCPKPNTRLPLVAPKMVNFALKRNATFMSGTLFSALLNGSPLP